jgi:hypothetical protein
VSRLRRLPKPVTILLALVLTTVSGAVFVPEAGSAPVWAPAATAPIHPGVQTITAGAQCTANFVFTDGVKVYIGQAAHCSGTGGNTETNGCLSGTLPVGTPVTVKGASKSGTMVYNSWATMQAKGESDPDICQYNDLAIIELDPADYARVNPSIPFWGGPVGVNTAGTVFGDTVYTYGNSSLRGGITQLSPKRGTSLGDGGSGWSHDVYTATPGIPGDSGSAFLDKSGKALGVLSTVQIAPLAGSNGVGDISREVAYMQANTTLSAVNIAPGTEPFTG